MRIRWIGIFSENYDDYGIPSGKLTNNYGKSPCLMGKSTISMAIFNSWGVLRGSAVGPSCPVHSWACWVSLLRPSERRPTSRSSCSWRWARRWRWPWRPCCWGRWTGGKVAGRGVTPKGGIYIYIYRYSYIYSYIYIVICIYVYLYAYMEQYVYIYIVLYYMHI